MFMHRTHIKLPLHINPETLIMNGAELVSA